MTLARSFPVLVGILSAGCIAGPFTLGEAIGTTGDANAPVDEIRPGGQTVGNVDGGGDEPTTDAARDRESSEAAQSETGSRPDAQDTAEASPPADAQAVLEAAAPDAPPSVTVHCSWGPVLSCHPCDPSASSIPCCLVTGGCGCTYGTAACQ